MTIGFWMIFEWEVEIKMINIKHLKAFLALSSELHFTRAAELVFITQPALSALIQQLELELGVQLVRRHTRQVELTVAGIEFTETTQKLVHDFEQAIHDVQTFKSIKRGQVNIAALPSVCSSLLPVILKQFNLRYPDIRLNVLDIPGQEIIDALNQRRIDFGLSYIQKNKDIEATKVMQDTLVVVCHHENALANKTSIKWRELVDEPMIAMNQGTTIRTLIDSTALSKDMKLNIILESKLMPTALAYVEAGIGISILASSGVSKQLSSNLRCIPLSTPSVKREISLLRLKNSTLSPAARSFAELLKSMSDELD